MTGPYEQIILFGDSITEQAASQERGFGFMPAIQDFFMRRYDVINRGFSGYNTTQALEVLPQFMPTPEQAKVCLMVVFFGANDAVLPGASTRQHVPLDRYAENLRAIVDHPCVRAHASPPAAAATRVRVLLITPPPCDEYTMEGCNYFDQGQAEILRKAQVTRQYAAACRRVGEDLRARNSGGQGGGGGGGVVVEVLDSWSLFMAETGWREGGRGGGGDGNGEEEPLPGSKDVPRHLALSELTHDGLHLAPRGYELLAKAFISKIQSAFSELDPQNKPCVMPTWRTLNGLE